MIGNLMMGKKVNPPLPSVWNHIRFIEIASLKRFVFITSTFVYLFIYSFGTHSRAHGIFTACTSVLRLIWPDVMIFELNVHSLATLLGTFLQSAGKSLLCDLAVGDWCVDGLSSSATPGIFTHVILESLIRQGQINQHNELKIYTKLFYTVNSIWNDVNIGVVKPDNDVPSCLLLAVTEKPC